MNKNLQRLAEPGDDLPLFVDIAAVDMGDIILIRFKAATDLRDFLFVHGFTLFLGIWSLIIPQTPAFS